MAYPPRAPHNDPDARGQYPGSSYPQSTIQVQIPRLVTNPEYYQKDGTCQGPAIQSYPAVQPQYVHPQEIFPPQAAAFLPTSSSVYANARSPAEATTQPSDSQGQPLDYQLLLLSLAEDYFAAAHGQGSMVALARMEVEMERYYKLIATGLGCLETVLKVCWPWRPQDGEKLGTWRAEAP